MRTVNAGPEYPAVMHTPEGEYSVPDRHGSSCGYGNSSSGRYAHAEARDTCSFIRRRSEATDADNKRLGKGADCAALNAHKRALSGKTSAGMKRESNALAGDAPQFDDSQCCNQNTKGVSNVDEITVTLR